MSTANPNQKLAEQIAKALLDNGLVDKSSEKRIIQGLSQGTMKESDWKVFLEEIINKPKPDSDEIKNAKH